MFHDPKTRDYTYTVSIPAKVTITQKILSDCKTDHYQDNVSTFYAWL